MRRMESQPPSLSEQLAGLRITARAPLETCAWIPGPIHTLIIAALARIFARLEQLFALWQAGSLPAPAPHQQRRAPHHPVESPRHRAQPSPRRRAPSRIATTQPIRAQPNRVRRPINQPAVPARSHALRPPTRPPRSTARAPPTCRPSHRLSPATGNARTCQNSFDIVTIIPKHCPHIRSSFRNSTA